MVVATEPGSAAQATVAYSGLAWLQASENTSDGTERSKATTGSRQRRATRAARCHWQKSSEDGHFCLLSSCRRGGQDGDMKIAFLIFDKLTALDAVGPYEVLSRWPEVDLQFVAKEAGMKRTDTGALGVNADAALDELTDPDILLIPGGEGNRPLIKDDEVLDWIRAADATTKWTTSVCTGSLVLGAAGLLEGKRATSHWAYRHELERFGAEPVAERVVVDGKYVTGAGVSAGIDMALHLTALEYGEDLARASSSGSSTTPSRRSTRARRRRPTRNSWSSSARSPDVTLSRGPYVQLLRGLTPFRVVSRVCR